MEYLMKINWEVGVSKAARSRTCAANGLVEDGDRTTFLLTEQSWLALPENEDCLAGSLSQSGINPISE
jgi:hypothetical protein